jgi:hypothetical protein
MLSAILLTGVSAVYLSHDLCDPFACPVIFRIVRIGDRVRATLYRTGTAKLGHGLWAYKDNADDTGQQGCNFEHEKHPLPDSDSLQLRQRFVA